MYQKLHLTIIDGKVNTVLSSVTSSPQCCTLCGATPKDMNDVDMVSLKSVNEEVLNYGLFTLHAWIQLMECCLDISYKLSIQMW